MSTAIVWFRRDLRIHDHPGLALAVREYETVVPLFILDPALLSGRHESPARKAFLAGCLEDLDRSLRERGSALVTLKGDPEVRLPGIARELSADAVIWTSDVSRFARDRDRRVREALRESGIKARPHAGNYIAGIARLKTGAGDPYRVFSPFYRNWVNSPRRELHRSPQGLKPLPRQLPEPTLPELVGRLISENRDRPEEPVALPGETAARRAFSRWLDGGIAGYDERHDRVAEPKSSSILSPYLRWGCLSPAELEHRAREQRGPGADAWSRQLAWRDFYAHVLLHWPENLDREFQVPMRNLEWEEDPERLDAWKNGTTGYPIVDAAMRQLARTGWMHNRARLIVGSFLTKDLQLDWRQGESWFGRLLLDGEPAQNNGNWQWIASVGTDPAPISRRLYNPVLQAKRHDPDGQYVRRWVPELRDVPHQTLHAPWEMSETAQREAGCRIGIEYPEPIVEHAFERKIALERYANAKETHSKWKV
ncbi:MAG: DNA photolyase family protein [Solirubrobacterales bacterium]|nr:DNA photolyase family protein [Solirubrobacterales bacterium]